MWHSVVEFRKLIARGKWQVEYFSGSRAPVREFRHPTRELRQLVRQRRGTVDPQTSPTREFAYIGLEHVESNTGDLVNFEPRLGQSIKSRSKLFEKGDILYGRLRPYLNKVYLPHGAASSGICSGEFYVLSPTPDGVEPRLLRELLASPVVSSFATRCQTGAALPRVGIKDLLALQIPVPPAEIQAELVAQLIEIDARRRDLKRELEALPLRILDVLRRELEQ